MAGTTGAKQNMRFSKEEIFGPLAPVFQFESEEEAIAMAEVVDNGIDEALAGHADLITVKINPDSRLSISINCPCKCSSKTC